MTEIVPAEGIFALLWVIIALPAAGAAILLFAGRRTNSWGPILGVLTVVASAVISVLMLLAMMDRPAKERTVVQNVYDWVFVGSFQASFALQLDQLSIVFVLLITIVGALIHIYSLGYMSHDPDRRKFFGYLNLFVAAMLVLVLANNYLLLYVGWEGVGLASYLLIGFWQHKPSAAAAAKKAFVINRVGDVGLSLAIMLIFVTFGSITFQDVFGQASDASEGTLTAIGLLLLLAAAGKSAQFPLQAWLLDAMEGPTPVSALIHAATMVTAGVYLIARSNAIYDAAAWAATAVVVVGLITILMGAIIASAKDDIKKSLAGSTMSQIGYMVFAAGLGPIGYVYAIFHLLTHGVFKAGLFLGAGSVMHGMNDNVNMRRYGALRGDMGVTFVTFMAGYLAIIGIPPFAGFWSKDEIIHAAFERNAIIGAAAILGDDHPPRVAGTRIRLPRYGPAVLGRHQGLAQARRRIRVGPHPLAHVLLHRRHPDRGHHRSHHRLGHVRPKGCTHRGSDGQRPHARGAPGPLRRRRERRARRATHLPSSADDHHLRQQSCRRLRQLDRNLRW